MNNYEVNKYGRKKVEDEILRLGASSVVSSASRKVYLEATSSNGSRTVEIKVKTKRKGDWQTTIDEGKPTDSPLKNDGKFWIFVDLVDGPRFWIVYDLWIRDNIFKEHEKYIDEHGGHRPINENSNHHSIDESRLEIWRDRWDILGIF